MWPCSLSTSDGLLVENVVLDPFAGSGTTGEASLACGRRFLGVVREFSHFCTAAKRLDPLGIGHTYLVKDLKHFLEAWYRIVPSEVPSRTGLESLKWNWKVRS